VPDGRVGFNCGCDELIKKWKALSFSTEGHQAGVLKAAKEGNQLRRYGAEKGRLTLSSTAAAQRKPVAHLLKKDRRLSMDYNWTKQLLVHKVSPIVEARIAVLRTRKFKTPRWSLCGSFLRSKKSQTS